MKTNRRQFLESAGLMFAGLGGASAVSAMPTAQPAKFDESFDVVVLGAGGAGLTAAIRLAEGGKKVLLVEKLAFCGGSSLICGGGVAVTETDLQKKAGIKDSVDTLYEDIMRTGGQLNDKAVVRAYAEASPEYYKWAMAHGMVLNTEKLSQSGSVPRNLSVNTGKSINAWVTLAKKAGVDLRTNTKAERLLCDAGMKRICGVELSTKNGKRTVESKDGVVIATGGFARNKELLEKYVPRMKNASTICAMGCEGDGLKMALAYGADVADMPYIKATFAFNLKATSIKDACWVFRDGAIVLNKNGKRFCNEEISKKDIGDYVLDQPDAVAFNLYDSAIREDAIKMDEAGGSVTYSEKKGLVFKGDTIEEVAQKAGLDPKVVRETVDRYNEDAKTTGVDREFGRKHLVDISGKIRPIEKAPFYIFPATAVLISTYCGLKINARAEVTDVFGDVIPGLYAAGEVTGSFHGRSYLGSTAFGKALIFGYIAAGSLLKA